MNASDREGAPEGAEAPPGGGADVPPVERPVAPGGVPPEVPELPSIPELPSLPEAPRAPVVEITESAPVVENAEGAAAPAQAPGRPGRDERRLRAFIAINLPVPVTRRIGDEIQALRRAVA